MTVGVFLTAPWVGLEFVIVVFPDPTHLRFPTVLIDFSLTVKVATLIFISGRCSAISSTKEGKSGFIYKLVKS